jgi:hypothetical protein
MMLTSESLHPQLDEPTIVKPSHVPQKGSNAGMVCVCYFDVIHKAVNDTWKRILHGGGAIEMPSMTDGGNWCKSSMNGVGSHDPVVFYKLEWLK